jgi:hypothetical protein
MGEIAPDCRSDTAGMRRRRRGSVRPWAGLVLAAISTCPLLAATAAPSDRPSEDEVKSAYLFNFGRFVEYSQGTPKGKTFDICVLGSDSIAPELQKITANEHVDDRPVRVLRLDKAGDARGCAVVFMGTSEAARLDKDMAALEGSDALTVSDLPQFLEHGGMIQFLFEKNRIRFAVNLDAVSHTHFQLSSQLLKVAVYVNSKSAPEGKR